MKDPKRDHNFENPPIMALGLSGHETLRPGGGTSG